MKPKFVTRFPGTPDLLPFALETDSDNVMVIELSAERYRAISFLDQRIITPHIPRGYAKWGELAEEAGDLRGKPDMIFHIGHVGSTLISRLLGELDDVLSLREPLILRQLAEIGRAQDAVWPGEKYRRRLGEALRWLSRTYAPDQKALVKASSFVSAVAGDMAPHIGKSLLLYVPPERYIPTILAGDASRQELAALAQSRLDRLHRNIGDTPYSLDGMNEAQLAAMSWAAEMTSLVSAFGEGGDRIKWLDFDAFLSAPAQCLSKIAEFYGYAHDETQVAALAGGPLMHRYSKAPEYEYSAHLRAELLQEARERYANDIKTAIAWLEQAARDFAIVDRAMETGNG